MSGFDQPPPVLQVGAITASHFAAWFANNRIEDGGSGGGAPTSGEYVLLVANGALPQARTLAVASPLTLTDDGGGNNVIVSLPSGFGVPAGSSGYVQYNNGGAFGSVADLYYSGGNLQFTPPTTSGYFQVADGLFNSPGLNDTVVQNGTLQVGDWNALFQGTMLVINSENGSFLLHQGSIQIDYGKTFNDNYNNPAIDINQRILTDDLGITQLSWSENGVTIANTLVANYLSVNNAGIDTSGNVFGTSLSTDNGTIKWVLGGHTTGTAVQAGKVALTINGTTYQLLTA